jgi:NADH:ubiquinone oxidoreductase subunit 6 (subunit J)
MSAALIIIAVFTLATAAVAMALRNLIHSALLLIASWAGIAAFYLWAGAEFVAFAQVLVYVGAVSMIVLFAVLLTRRAREEPRLAWMGFLRFLTALAPAALVFAVLAGAVLSSGVGENATAPAPHVSVIEIGRELAGQHAAAVLIVGLILTVALLGAIVIASGDRPEDSR